ncbi:MAG: cytochrome c maturation protein CcmE [Gammaproteobacteria bacterium]|nr:cytochrome c maturation protein CcmE [Gammaproteobacteria bacterium]
MNRKQKNKLAIIISIIIILSIAIGLVLYALKQNINLFYTPTQLVNTKVSPNQNVRLGGYVEKHSVHYDASGESVSFIVSDQFHSLPVSYHGVLPSLFREGQGVVMTGKLNSQNQFNASEVLAKHDEKYMPPVLAKELNKQSEKKS